MYKVLCAFALLSAVVIGCSSTSSQAASDLPVGAFVTSPVRTPGELANLILSDAVTAKRFADHFGIDSGEVAAYIYNNLKLGRLDRPTVVTAFYSAGGRILSHRKVLPAGTTVFVDHQGRPLFSQKCGNPLTKVLTMPPGELGPPVTSHVEPVTEIMETSAQYQPVAQGSDLPVVVPPPVSVTAPLVQLLPAVVAPLLLGATNASGSKVVPEPSMLTVQAAGMIWLSAAALRARRRRA